MHNNANRTIIVNVNPFFFSMLIWQEEERERSVSAAFPLLIQNWSSLASKLINEHIRERCWAEKKNNHTSPWHIEVTSLYHDVIIVQIIVSINQNVFQVKSSKSFFRFSLLEPPGEKIALC